jgi:hypothetical protein
VADVSATNGAVAWHNQDPTVIGRVGGAFDSALQSFRDGFEQAIVDTRDEAEDGLSDSRVMVQIGMLLGFVYLGFLTVWFWATRRGSSLRA